MQLLYKNLFRTFVCKRKKKGVIVTRLLLKLFVAQHTVMVSTMIWNSLYDIKCKEINVMLIINFCLQPRRRFRRISKIRFNHVAWEHIDLEKQFY